MELIYLKDCLKEQEEFMFWLYQEQNFIKMGALIKILKDGPAIISTTKDGIGSFLEKTHIIHEDDSTEETTKQYAICRCGKSKNQPFCDGSHKE